MRIACVKLFYQMMNVNVKQIKLILQDRWGR